MQSIHPTFWLMGLAAFALPIGMTAGCHQSSQQQVSAAKPITAIHASSRTTGITITGVN